MSTEAMKLAKAWFERNTYGDEAVDVYEALCEALAQPPQEPVADEVRCPECGYLTKHTEHIGCLRKKLNAINAFEQRNFAIVNMDKAPPAQPPQEPVAKDNSNYRLDPPGLDPRYTSPPAQQEQQEPVAYFETITGRIAVRDDTHRRKFPMCYRPLVFGDTSPPARKPLTEEEMEKIAAEYWLYPRKFVRAIEAAHGIKGDA